MMRRAVLPPLLLAAASVAAAAAPASIPLAMRESMAARDVAAAAAVAVASGPDAFDGGSDWDWVDRAPVEPERAERSVWRAVLSSALLPGLGERYVGDSRRAAFFFGVEGAIWSTFGFYRVQADLRADRQREFAHFRAGAPEDQDPDYYEHIGLWLSLEEWHDIVRQDARLRFEDDPAAREAFFEANKRYDEGQSWSWPDDETRTQYRRLRSRAERSYRNARLAAGAMLFNRVASMIDALALARSHNGRLREEQARLTLRIAPALTADGLVIGPVVTTRY